MNTLNNDTIFIISTSLNLGGSEIQAVRLANLYSKSNSKIFPKLRSLLWFLRVAIRSRVNFGNRKATVVSFLFHASLFGFLITF